ncbi:GGDEF domain-containing protein [Cohnella luojiensis]|uniref:GGDEF domain-containing protein n=1 Tax=Cohnella luojiensis TaxID=652876 RepID=A0A4Y8M6R1_9BACL|nr:GGDEF domain-containing protein [Cohnella luojiensis]TFE31686.1 GGDEF domain-containing protein [Cohnella luojiensis]
MKRFDRIYILQLFMFLSMVVWALYLAFTIELYPLNYIWFGLVTLLSILGVMRGLLASLVAAIFVIFGYGSWILYRLYIEKSIADMVFNDLFWMFVFPIATLISGIYGRELSDISKQVALFDENFSERITTDDVTGFQNNKQFKQDLDEEVSRSIRYKRTMTLVLMEVAHYKELWKSYGKITGDQILKQISGQIEVVLRDVDKKAYLGDGLFAAILPETPIENANIVKIRMHEAVMRTDFIVAARGKRMKIKLKIGIAGCPDEGEDPTTLFDKARAGMVYDVG